MRSCALLTLARRTLYSVNIHALISLDMQKDPFWVARGWQTWRQAFGLFALSRAYGVRSLVASSPAPSYCGLTDGPLLPVNELLCISTWRLSICRLAGGLVRRSCRFLPGLLCERVGVAVGMKTALLIHWDKQAPHVSQNDPCLTLLSVEPRIRKSRKTARVPKGTSHTKIHSM